MGISPTFVLIILSTTFVVEVVVEKNLFDALNSGDKELVSQLLSKGADINALSDVGETALTVACVRNDSEMALLLIEKGADVNLAGMKATPPLIQATKFGMNSVVTTLIDKGANISATCDMSGNIYSPLMIAIDRGHFDTLKILIEKGADVKTSDQYGTTPLILAINERRQDAALLLIEKGADMETPNEFGSTPLLFSMYLKMPVVFEALIKKGANLNIASDGGLHPIFFAIASGFLREAKILIEKGADINAKDDHGFSPLIQVCKTKLTTSNFTDKVELFELLIEKGDDVNFADKYGKTPLIWSAINGYDYFVEKLIEKKVDVNAKDAERRTALFYVSRNYEMGERLIKSGSKVSKDDWDGVPSLINAMQGSFAKMVKLLVANGAEVDQENLETFLTRVDLAGDASLISLVNKAVADKKV